MTTTDDRPQIRIDPFFDGEGGPVTQPQLPGYAEAAEPGQPIPGVTAGQAAGVRGSTIAGVNNLQGYRPVNQMGLIDGRPMSAVMRSGPEGLQGTVIPHATQGGIPAGTRPHETQDLEVNIDPHIEGQRTTVRLGDVPQALNQAEQMAREVTPDPYNIETQRLRGAAVMQGVAALAGSQRVHQPMPHTTAPQAANIPAPNMAQLTGNGATPSGMPRQVSPLQAFQQTPQHVDPESGREMRAIDLAGSPPPRERITPPQMRVTYEIQNFGMHTARYHDVIKAPGFLVLVYKEYGGDEMYVPPSGDNVPEMALQIDGDDRVYLVHTTGFVYAYEGTNFCVLMVEREAPLDAVAQEVPTQ